jgi:hypothetical protein
MSEKFDNLFVEADVLNEDILKEILSGKIKMTKEGEVIFEKEFEPTKSILLYLLANKVLVIKKIKQEEAEGPKTIYTKTGVAEGTVKRYVRDLQKKNLLISNKGQYYVPNHALNKIKKMMEEDKV